MGTLKRLIPFALAMIVPFLLDQPYLLRLYSSIALYACLGLGLTVTVGYNGLLDMGYMAFFGLGAYMYGLLASPQLGIHLSFWLILPTAAVAVGVLGLLAAFPTRRLKGDYLAIVTLALAEIVRLLFNNLDGITNGPDGLLRLDPVKIAGVSLWSYQDMALLLTAAAGLVWFLVDGLRRSRLGRQWSAVRDDAIAASAIGIYPVRARLTAFAMGAALAGISGVLFAVWQGAVFPDKFGMNELVNVFCMVVLGGLGNPAGAVLGAAALVILPELLRGLALYRMLIYAILLIGLVRLRPQGLWPARLSTRALDGAKGQNNAGQESQQPTANSHQSEARTSSPSTTQLKVSGISRRFGGLQALKDVSLMVVPGQIVSLIGPNGAGKTTLLNIISGVTAPDGGSVILGGHDLTRCPSHRVNHYGLARTFQHIRLFNGLDLIDNLTVGTADDRAAIGEALRLLERVAPHLRGHLHSPVTDLSYADRRRVEIIRALMHQPKLLILDEPAAGMTQSEIQDLRELLLALKTQGLGILLVEHQMDLVMEISDRVVVLDHGEVIASGRPDDIQQNPRVVEAYLGRGLSADLQVGTPLAGPDLLQVTELRAGYGEVNVLRDVSLRVKPGEAVVLLGANAAGKTTLMKALAGGLSPRAGTLQWVGTDITKCDAADRVHMGIAHVPEGRRIFPRLTVMDNLRLGAFLKPRGIQQRLDTVYQLFPRLREREKQMAGTLSGGEQQMLAIARALMSSPRLLLLDEPSMGLAPVVVEHLFTTIAAINRQGVSVLMVEQNAHMALAVAHRGYLLQNGRIVGEGSAEELRTNEEMKKAYLSA